jgi:hypothetical protein
MKIVIYTRSMNYDLYRLSSSSVSLPYKRKRCAFTSADGYLYDHIVKSNADILINLDEDAFIIDNEKLKKLIEFVIDNEYVNCGMSDGGVVDIRKHNPLVTNPYFNILNIKEIKKKFNLKEIQKNYSQHNQDFEKFTPFNLMKTQFSYDYFEPYNPFFVWLAVNFKTLFLDADVHSDGISTVLHDHLGSPFLYHSWYSRFYGVDENHTKRIKDLYAEATGNIVQKPSILNKIIHLKDQLGMKYYYPLKLRIEDKLR